MNVEHRHSELTLVATVTSSRPRWPAWCVRLALRWNHQGIDRLQAQLSDEFGIESTVPLYRELESLMQERAALLMRLRSRATH